jgi:hypothetical protein
MPFCGYILYLSDGSPSQQKKPIQIKNQKSKSKAFPSNQNNQKFAPLISCDGIFFSHGAAPCYYHSTTSFVPLKVLYCFFFFFFIFNFPLNHV